MKAKTQEDPKPTTTTTPSQFTFTLTKIAVSQICQSVGFKSTQNSALQTLTDVAARYIQALAASAASAATFSGRTQSSLVDIIRALEELNSIRGFTGASVVNRDLYGSSTLVGVMNFVEFTDEIPFAKPIPSNFFGCRQMGLVPNFSRLKDGSGGFGHVPKWLPDLPSARGSYEVLNAQQSRVSKELMHEGFFLESGDLVSARGSCKARVLEGLTHEESLLKNREGVSAFQTRDVMKVVVEIEGTRELPERRRRVRFKIGKGGVVEVGGLGLDLDLDLDLRSGVFRGGKRVLCQNWCDGDDEDSSSNISLKRGKDDYDDEYLNK